MSTESFELAILLTFVSFAKLFRSLRNASHFAQSHLSPSAPLCHVHYQVWLPTSSHSSNSTIPIFVRYTFFFACLSSWCLSRKGLAIPLNAKPGFPIPLSDSFPYISMSVSPKRLCVLAILHTAQLGPPRLYGKCFCVCLSRSNTTLSRA
ncbi:hypothetical protein B296_00019577 [Ensete ventricosum]|uniref:Uncharacterized protein n=1 Tax=Ensete ventricosum TaxID=4639 RepID=A0A426X3I9_ENSVE|nr:hypothetical protein B296_00019577 [Ensete ventricosum]